MPYKTCPKCSTRCGVRTHSCPQCHEILYNKEAKLLTKNKFRDKPIKLKKIFVAPKKIQWTELQPGDIIKVLNGTGPYQIINGERICMGYAGKFKVKELDDDGIYAYPVKASESGHCYIYMGKEVLSKWGTNLSPHKIRKVNNV